MRQYKWKQLIQEALSYSTGRLLTNNLILLKLRFPYQILPSKIHLLQRQHGRKNQFGNLSAQCSV